VCQHGRKELGIVQFHIDLVNSFLRDAAVPFLL
jgi:hypothetical protein